VPLSGLEPDANFPGTQLQSLKLDQFLRMKVVGLREEHATVAALIRFYAHVVGGVHAGEPESDIERELLRFETSFFFQDVPMVRQQLRSIGRIVLTGLTPLKAAIEARQI
jgi:hypothetical protein